MLGCNVPLFIQINEYANIGFALQDHAQQTIFYSLTGLHGAHVTIGLLLLLIVTIRALPRPLQPRARSTSRRRGARASTWHFVDIMWIVVVYTTVYVL